MLQQGGNSRRRFGDNDIVDERTLAARRRLDEACDELLGVGSQSDLLFAGTVSAQSPLSHTMHSLTGLVVDGRVDVDAAATRRRRAPYADNRANIRK